MRRLSLAVLLVAALPVLADDEVAIPADHYTLAELNSFRATPTMEELNAFLLRLTKTSPYLKLDTLGKTGMGRRIPVVIVSKEKTFTPDEAWKTRKPVVLILNSIHGGEVDGTDACLMLLRDIALTNRKAILNGVTLLVVPVYNVDGHERVGKYNRPNQNGPADGMGFRTTARGHDLNRDWLKLEAPETRALVAFAAAWKPDLVIDDHVTDGADFQAALTLAYGAEPWTPKPVADWLAKAVPRAQRQVEELGFGTGPYVDFVDGLDPAKGIDLAAITPPRYSTGYFPLRGAGAILVETHAIKPYADRVRANLHFLRALLEETAARGKELLAARQAAREETRRAAAGAAYPVDDETDPTRSETIDFPTYVWKQELSPVTGKPVLRYDPKQKVTLTLPLFSHTRTKTSVPRPAAYLVPAGWPDIGERLATHGIRTRRLARPLTLEVGTYRAESPTFAKESYQGLHRVTAKIHRATETREVPAGSLYVPLDTELAPVAMHLHEPESPDSLFAWGLLSGVLEMKEYIDTRVLDPLAEAMLARDPKLKEEWEAKLKDPAFAADARARWLFFYKKTPYWDESLGLVPVYRLEKPLSESALAEAAAPE
jgi:hypothetical protein